jgi:hypothetical protein
MKLCKLSRKDQPQREHLHQILGEYADLCQFMFVKKKVIHLTGRRDVVEEVKRKIESFLQNLVHSIYFLGSMILKFKRKYPNSKIF